MFPPSGVARYKRVSPVLELELGPEGVSLVSAGEGSLFVQRYRAFETRESYAIELEQRTAYLQGEKEHLVRTSIQANAHIQVEQGRANRVFVSFDNFVIHVFDNERELALRTVDSLMSGVVLEQSFSPQLGLGRAAPLVRINPQVGRVLFFLSDVMRSVWSPLATEAIGGNAKWEFTDKSHEEALCLLGSVQSQAIVSNPTQLRVKHNFIVQRDACEQNYKKRKRSFSFSIAGEGQGSVEVSLEEGQVQSAEGSINYLGITTADKAIAPQTNQRLTLSFSIKKLKEI